MGRDPIEEAGGLNLYGFCGNNSVSRTDALGLSWVIDESDYGTFFTTSTDAFGNIGNWNFSSRDDAMRWAQAWMDHDMSVVGERAITDKYLNDSEAVAQLQSSTIDVHSVAIHLMGLPGMSDLVRQAFGGLFPGGFDGIADDSLLSYIDPLSVFTMFFGVPKPPPQQRSINLVVGSDSSFGTIDSRYREIVLGNVRVVQGFLNQHGLGHISVNTIFSNAPIEAPVVYDAALTNTGETFSGAAQARLSQLANGIAGAVPVLLTNAPFTDEGPYRTQGFAQMRANGMVLHSLAVATNPWLIAHELGHLGGYRTPILRNFHSSSSPLNVMWPGRVTPGVDPALVYVDGQWLDALKKLSIPAGVPSRGP